MQVEAVGGRVSGLFKMKDGVDGGMGVFGVAFI